MSNPIVMYPAVFFFMLIILGVFDIVGLFAWLLSIIGSVVLTPKLKPLAVKLDGSLEPVQEATFRRNELEENVSQVAEDSNVSQADAINAEEDIKVESSEEDKKLVVEELVNNVEAGHESSGAESQPGDTDTEVDFEGLGSEMKLIYAIQLNLLSEVKELVESGKVSIENELHLNGEDRATKMSPLSSAVNGGYVDIVEYLLSKGADPNHRIPYEEVGEMSPLGIAINNAPSKYPVYIKIIELLLGAGAEVNPVDNEKPLIMFAAEKGCHPQIMNMIIKSGLELDLKGQGARALMMAASVNDPAVIRLFVKARGSVNVENKKYGVTPLHMAALEGAKEAAEALIELGADISHKAHDGRTAIDIAEEEGQQLVKSFLSGHVRNTDNDASLPSTEEAAKYLEVLMITISQDSLKDLNFFFEKEVPGINEYELGTALYMAASSGSYETLTFLLEKGVSPNLLRLSQTNGMGNSPLHEAIMFFNDNPDAYIKVIRKLFEHGAYVNITDMVAHDNGYDVREIGLLNLVVALGLPSEVMQILFDADIDINEFNQGITALRDAASRGYPDIISELISHGVKVNSITENGRTALHRAACFGEIKAAQALVDFGAAIALKDSDGLTAAELAKQEGHDELYAYLSEFDA